MSASPPPPASRPLRRPPSWSRRRVLLTGGAVGPPLFVLVFLLEGITRTAYDPWRHPVSSLSIGPDGWIQRTNFIVLGVLVIALAAAASPTVRREGGSRAGLFLIALTGVGLIGAGIFVADPFSGFPPGTPGYPDPRTGHGILHDLSGVPVFIGLPIAVVLFARHARRRGQHGWAWYSLATAAGFLIGFALTSRAFGQDPTLVPIGGLLQRLTLTTGWTWLTAFALRLLRQRPD